MHRELATFWSYSLIFAYCSISLGLFGLLLSGSGLGVLGEGWESWRRHGINI